LHRQKMPDRKVELNVYSYFLTPKNIRFLCVRICTTVSQQIMK
ncbi:hypothetical protein DOY81_002767, partial [Sarcophaga bullata]